MWCRLFSLLYSRRCVRAAGKLVLEGVGCCTVHGENKILVYIFYLNNPDEEATAEKSIRQRSRQSTSNTSSRRVRKETTRESRPRGTSCASSISSYLSCSYTICRFDNETFRDSSATKMAATGRRQRRRKNCYKGSLFLFFSFLLILLVVYLLHVAVRREIGSCGLG